MPTDMWTREKLRSQILKFHTMDYRWDRLKEPMRSLQKSAILILLSLKDGVIYIWLTKRSEDVKLYKNQVSFPGGKWEEGDRNAVDTALREANEEIGLDSCEVEVFAELPPKISIHRILVTPIVGIVHHDFQPKPNNEVDLVFHLPLERFLLEQDHWSNSFEGYSVKDYMHYFQDVYDGQSVVTWGMTAHFAIELACGVLQKIPEYSFSPNVDVTPDDPFAGSRAFLNSKWWERIEEWKSKL